MRQIQVFPLIAAYKAFELLCGDDELCIRILCHKGKPFRGICGIKGLIGAARLQHAQ